MCPLPLSHPSISLPLPSTLPLLSLAFLLSPSLPLPLLPFLSPSPSPPLSQEPITAMTWAHGDQKLFIATKNLLHSLSVHRGIPSLQSLCQKGIAQYLPGREQSYNLVLPMRMKMSVAEVFDPVVQVIEINMYVHVLVHGQIYMCMYKLVKLLQTSSIMYFKRPSCIIKHMQKQAKTSA